MTIKTRIPFDIGNLVKQQIPQPKMNKSFSDKCESLRNMSLTAADNDRTCFRNLIKIMAFNRRNDVVIIFKILESDHYHPPFFLQFFDLGRQSSHIAASRAGLGIRSKDTFRSDGIAADNGNPIPVMQDENRLLRFLGILPAAVIFQVFFPILIQSEQKRLDPPIKNMIAR